MLQESVGLLLRPRVTVRLTHDGPGSGSSANQPRSTLVAPRPFRNGPGESSSSCLGRERIFKNSSGLHTSSLSPFFFLGERDSVREHERGEQERSEQQAGGEPHTGLDPRTLRS